MFIRAGLKFLEKYYLVSVIILIGLLTLIETVRHRDAIFAVTDKPAIGQAYGESQYVLGDKSLKKIDDGTLYIYAAEAYFKGDDPTTINFEHPPLGKYIFGLSLFLFNRVLVLNIGLFSIALALFATLLRQLKIFQLVCIFGRDLSCSG